MANVCACGCGELLPEGSTRQYKRGHKNRAENPDTGFTETPLTEEAETPGFATIEDAARLTPDDPEPRDVRAEDKPKVVIKITPSIRRDIEGKLALGFGMLGSAWSMIDPLCGPVLVDIGPQIAKAYTPLLLQSPEVVRFMTKSGNFMLWVNALMATIPLIQMFAAHHILHTVSREMMANQNGYAPTPQSEYVVQ